MADRSPADVDLTSPQVGTIFQNISVEVRPVQHRISVNEMLQLCQTVLEGIIGDDDFCTIDVFNHLSSLYFCLVPTGGRLLEHFMTAFAGFTPRREWRSIVKKWAGGQDVSASVALLVNKVKVDFYYYVLGALTSRGSSCTRQLFYTTLLLVHKGLSRTGIEATGQMNLTLSPRTYDAELAIHLEREEFRIRYVSFM